MDSLERAARDAAGRAYCPYSRYRVGATLESEDGQVFVGCNVENASYPLGFCAEAGALGSAVAQGVRSFKRIHIVGGTERPAAPCGSCRQMLSEFGTDLLVRSSTLFEDGATREWSLHELLPECYGPSDLEGVDRDPDSD